MLPTAYEFHWDLGHVAFLGIFYGVVALVLVTLFVATRRWLLDLRRRRASDIAWHESFHDLPAERKLCRHVFDGSLPYGRCDHGFDCADCTLHPVLEEKRRSRAGTERRGSSGRGERLYHRGHTWVEHEEDGTLTVGLDRLARCCLGRPDRIVLPEVGRTLARHEAGAVFERDGIRVKLRSPLGGQVVELGGPGDDWLYRLDPGDDRGEAHLLSGEEADLWMLREMEWLQGRLCRAEGTAVLADGGIPVDDLPAVHPDADWDDLWGRLCLDV